MLYNVWMFLPPWIFAVVVSILGRWCERLIERRLAPDDAWVQEEEHWYAGAGLLPNLLFLSLFPTLVLTLTQGMLPLQGARAGLALGLLAFLIGCVPARLSQTRRLGWDLALWGIFVDFIRVGGALLIAGYLLGE